MIDITKDVSTEAQKGGLNPNASAFTTGIFAADQGDGGRSPRRTRDGEGEIMVPGRDNGPWDDRLAIDTGIRAGSQGDGGRSPRHGKGDEVMEPGNDNGPFDDKFSPLTPFGGLEGLRTSKELPVDLPLIDLGGPEGAAIGTPGASGGIGLGD